MKALIQLGNMSAIFICGVCVGWLIGLSASPVLHLVISSVIGAISAVVAAAAGLATKNAPETSLLSRTRAAVSPVPLAFLLVGIVAGSMLGLRARVNDWFAPSPAEFAVHWQSTGLPSEDLSKLLLAELHQIPQKTAASTGGDAHIPALFAAPSASDCAAMQRENDGALKGHLKTLVKSDEAKKTIDKCGEEALQAIRDVICTGSR